MASWKTTGLVGMGKCGRRGDTHKPPTKNSVDNSSQLNAIVSIRSLLALVPFLTAA
jgi:hypothetical protein